MVFEGINGSKGVEEQRDKFSLAPLLYPLTNLEGHLLIKISE